MITKKIWYLFILCLLPMMSMQATFSDLFDSTEESISEVTLTTIEYDLTSKITQLKELQASLSNWKEKRNTLKDIVQYIPPGQLSKLSPEKVTEYFFPARKTKVQTGQQEKYIYRCPGHFRYIGNPLNLWRKSEDCTYTKVPAICNQIARGGCEYVRTAYEPTYEDISIYTGENINYNGQTLPWQPYLKYKNYEATFNLPYIDNAQDLNALIDAFIHFFQGKVARLETIKEANKKELEKKEKAEAASAARTEKIKDAVFNGTKDLVSNQISQNSEMQKIKAAEKEKNKEFMKNLPRTAAIGTGAAAVIVTTFALAWHGGHVGFSELQKRLNKPKLIKETTRPENMWQMIVGKDLEESRLDEFVWPDGLQSRLEYLIEQTLQAKEAESSFKNVLLYGPPGTGKTMFAKSLARASGVHYAMFSGADFNNFESLAEAQAELDNIISWGENSDKGLILFVDEADCFLVERTFPDTTPRQCALTNMFLSRVEKPSSNKIMWVFCTNNRGSLDIAVESRISEAYEFKRPSDKNGTQILLQYLEQKDVLLTDAIKKEIVKISSNLVGLSGRDIQEIAEEIARRSNVNNMTLNFDLIKTAIEEKKDNMTAMAQAQAEYRRARYGKT